MQSDVEVQCLPIKRVFAGRPWWPAQDGEHFRDVREDQGRVQFHPKSISFVSLHLFACFTEKYIRRFLFPYKFIYSIFLLD